MSLTFAAASPDAIPLFVVENNDPKIPDIAQSWATANGFKGTAGAVLCVPDSDGNIAAVLVGNGDPNTRKRSRFHLGAAATKLPAGTYAFAHDLDDATAQEAALGWLLSSYKFTRYKDSTPPAARLVAPPNINATRIETIAAGEVLTRDLINTPASDMGPKDLAKATHDLAARHSATVTEIAGQALLDNNFPMIHSVGRAAAQEPRLLDLRWGKTGPKVTLVGKGVCFDTGGLNIKPGGSMGLMKKDMGGAATTLGLAHMIMGLDLPVQLRLLIPAVENSISSAAFRPQDILTSRKGLTVEINNTDAEGRLVLADALALADEDDPDLVISMATLTGAARVAVGPDLSPFFTDDDTHAAALQQAAQEVADPVWRLPFHDPYEALIEPGIADLDNAPSGGMAGSITAALFLRRFVAAPYMHFDIYGWSPSNKPARPKGGVGMGARALLEALPKMLGL